MNSAEWLRWYADRRLAEERDDLGEFGTALVTTNHIERLRTIADEFEDLMKGVAKLEREKQEKR